MELLNSEFLKLYIDKIHETNKTMDLSAMKNILKMEDSEIMYILYNGMLVMSKYNNGLLTNELMKKTVNDAAKLSPEGKVLKSQYDYLIKEIDKYEGYEKIPILNAMIAFINWTVTVLNIVNK
jgi:hypothetical protein